MAFGAVDSDGFQTDEGDVTPAAAEPAAPIASDAPAAPVPAPDGKQPRAADGKFAATRKDAEPAENVEAVTPAAKPAEKPDAKPADKLEAKPVEQPADKRGKPRSDPEARIGQALREAREEREARIRLEERVRLFESGQIKSGERQPARPVDDDPEPRIEDYQGDEARYVKDAIAHGVRHELKQHTQQQQQAQSKSFTAQRHRERETAYVGRLDAAIKADPEFLNKLSDDVGNLKPSHHLTSGERRTVWNAIADEIVDSEHAPALLVHLSGNPDELQRLATLQPRELTRHMAILGHSLANAAPTPAAAPPAQISQARPPVRPVEGGAPVVSDDSLDDESISDDEYRERFNRQQIARRRATHAR